MYHDPVIMDMTRQATETIRVTPENWERLNKRKKPGDTFNDVITRLLSERDGAAEEGTGDPNSGAAATNSGRF